MRFIFHNPHDLIWFKAPVTYDFKSKGVQKYVHLLDYFLDHDKKVYVYIDRFKFYDNRHGLRKLLPPLTWFYIWLLFNKINPLRFKIITDINKMYKDDILFMFLYGNFTFQTGELTAARKESNSLIGRSAAFKVVHLTHYMYHASVGSENCKNANIDLLVAENNLSRNSKFFQSTFPWYRKDVYVLPFVPKDKFVRVKKFHERENKAVASGTITYPMDDTAFLSFFGHSMLHPMRTQIYENREKLQTYIDSIISPVIEDQALAGTANYAKQIKYFSHDIVQLYNNYTMFIVPEEVSGLPGIGFAEGMKCGSAFIGLNDPMYTDIGLVDKVHYIGYDGTMDDLIHKIEYYQNHSLELETIAENGYNFVSEHCNKKNVVETFLRDMKTLCLHRNSTNR